MALILSFFKYTLCFLKYIGPLGIYGILSHNLRTTQSLGLPPYTLPLTDYENFEKKNHIYIKYSTFKNTH